MTQVIEAMINGQLIMYHVEHKYFFKSYLISINFIVFLKYSEIFPIEMIEILSFCFISI